MSSVLGKLIEVGVVLEHVSVVIDHLSSFPGRDRTVGTDTSKSAIKKELLQSVLPFGKQLTSSQARGYFMSLVSAGKFSRCQKPGHKKRDCPYNRGGRDHQEDRMAEREPDRGREVAEVKGQRLVVQVQNKVPEPLFFRRVEEDWEDEIPEASRAVTKPAISESQDARQKLISKFSPFGLIYHPVESPVVRQSSDSLVSFGPLSSSPTSVVGT